MLRRAAQGEFEDHWHIAGIRRDAHFEGLARTSAENQTTVPPEGDRNMSAPTERADPDLQLQAAWLAQVSDPTEASVSEQAPRQSGHSPRASTDSLEPVDRATEQHVALPLGSVLRRRSGLVMISLIGFILALALPLVIGIPQLPETWREPAGGHTIGLGTSEPLTSAIPGVRDELESPKLLVQSSRGVSGEPAPIGVTVRGRTDGAVVTIKGLLPGMELSTGGAVAGNTWQISASDLQYAWVAPPKDFVGSADFVAELRLPNGQTADRQTIRLEWTRPAAGSGPEPEPEHIAPGREIEATPPIPPAADQHPNDPDVVATAPQLTPSQDQFYRGREQSKSARAHGKNNLHRSVGVGSQPVPLASPPVRDSMHAPKGFWDWSR